MSDAKIKDANRAATKEIDYELRLAPSWEAAGWAIIGDYTPHATRT
jgi:hypothetical protein